MIQARRTKLKTLGWDPPSGMGLLYLDLDSPRESIKIPAPINVMRQYIRKMGLDWNPPTREDTGKDLYSNRERSDHVMLEHMLKRKRDDTNEEEDGWTKVWVKREF